jgi:anti-anti-sigma regulatory factor
VGIFSLFGKRDGQPKAVPDRNSARKKPRGTTVSSKTSPVADLNAPSSGFPHAVARGMMAKATALKIDAIESEMSSEFIKYPTGGNSLPVPDHTETGAVANSRDHTTPVAPIPLSPATPSLQAGTARRQEMGATTQLLLNDEAISGHAAITETETAPVIAEAAILYANGQVDIVEHVLQAAVRDAGLGDALPIAWHMLFDLYSICGKQAQFDQLSIEYASRFETSPPPWPDIEALPQPPSASGVRPIPAVAFSGKLNSGIVRQLERVKLLAMNSKAVRLDFTGVTDADPIGCGLLLRVLKRLQNSGNDPILTGARNLADRIHAILQVGRRDETDAPWMLRLEVLRMLNLEKEFEETSIDYCITFEVSPPPFVAPLPGPAATRRAVTAMENSEAFRMPAVVKGRNEHLVQEIAAYAHDRRPAIIDCAGLHRVDFGAAGYLLSSLAPLKTSGLEIEFHEVNHLVAALFNVVGLNTLIRIYPRKT